jgi:2'-5' RNA ligase
MPMMETDGTSITTDAIARPPTNAQAARVFVGLKVVAEVAGELADLARPLERYAVRLVQRSDIHLTLVPPWNETHIAHAVETLRAAISGFGSFLLTFAHVGYGPTLHHPRLLWVDCAASEELKELRTALLTAYGQIDSRPFQPHVTLARIPRSGRVIARQNPMDQTLSLTQCVTSVELFQSPPKGQSGYQVLASLPLGARPHPQSMEAT